MAGGRRDRRRVPAGRRGSAGRPGPLARAREAAGPADADRPRPVPVEGVPTGHLGADRPAGGAGRHDDRPADLLPDGAGVRRDAGGPVNRPAVAHHVRHGPARRPQGRGPPAQQHHPGGLRPADDRPRGPAADHPPGRLGLVVRGAARDRGCGAGPAGLPAQQLHVGADDRRAGQRGRGGELGRRLVRPVVRPGVRRRHHAGDAVLHVHHDVGRQRRAPRRRQAAGGRGAGGRRRGHVQHAARRSCWRTSPRTSRTRSSASTPTPGPAHCRWRSLVPLLAALAGLVTSFRMLRLAEPEPSTTTEGMAWG